MLGFHVSLYIILLSYLLTSYLLLVSQNIAPWKRYGRYAIILTIVLYHLFN